VSRRSTRLDSHSARVMILLRHFGPTSEKQLLGLTKLAKLDFLLRYPLFTERLLERRGEPWALGTEPSDSERLAVETRMIRYKYGPWDNRYYPILGALLGLGLAQVSKSGRSFEMNLTPEGAELAAELAREPEWAPLDERALFLKQRFDFTGSKLKNLIYQELPEVIDRPLRTVI
jgi:hypothetical protein